MIPVARVPEPAGFDEQVRKRGNQWLAEHPDAERPHDYWSPFREVLAEGFKQLCGYAAMEDFSGTVDHFHAFKTHPALAYEWSKWYRRYAEAASEEERRFQLEQLRKSAPLIAEAIERETAVAPAEAEPPPTPGSATGALRY